MPAWGILILAILTFIVGILGVMVRARKNRINQMQIDIQLYDKRFGIYMAVVDLFIHMLRHADVSQEAIAEYSEKTKEGAFLFDDEISSFLDELLNKAQKLRSANYMLRSINSGVPEEPSSKVAETLEIQKWIHDNFLGLKGKFKKHLRLN